MTQTFRRSPLALAVLCLLEAGPMHPYGIQRLLKEWGKDKVINVGQRASLYRMIGRLEEAGLIVAGDTGRDERYPERTTYEITDVGQKTARKWMAEIVSTPRNEYPEFPAALSFLMMLTPQAAQGLFSQRRDRLARRMAELDADLATELEGFDVPRVALAESEYLRAVTEAEMNWVTSVLASLQDGSFTWDRADLGPAAAD